MTCTPILNRSRHYINNSITYLQHCWRTEFPNEYNMQLRKQRYVSNLRACVSSGIHGHWSCLVTVQAWLFPYVFFLYVLCSCLNYCFFFLCPLDCCAVGLSSPVIVFKTSQQSCAAWQHTSTVGVRNCCPVVYCPVGVSHRWLATKACLISIPFCLSPYKNNYYQKLSICL